jgi:hypothetical protein
MPDGARYGAEETAGRFPRRHGTRSADENGVPLASSGAEATRLMQGGPVVNSHHEPRVKPFRVGPRKVRRVT